MLVLITKQKKKLGLIKKEKKFKIIQFPFTAIIEEIHLIGIGFMSKPITRKHQRFIKVLNEDEVYLYKNSTSDCHACLDLYGHVKRDNINQDPFLSKALYWDSN